jgi:hypothetical protein
MVVSRRVVGLGLGLGLLSGSLASAADVTGNVTFVGIQPCRMVDTRGGTFTGQAGPPALAAGVPRNFAITGTVAGLPAQCGIPTNAVAIAGNFVIVNPAGAGNLRAWPAGGAVPLAAALNYSAGQTIGNGSTVPLGAAGVSVRADVSGGDLVLDVNGYYVPRPVTIEITDGPGSTTSTTPVAIASIYSANFRNQGHDQARLVARWQNSQQAPACSGTLTASLVQRTSCSATTGGTILATISHSCGLKAWLDYSALFTIPTGAACLDLEANVNAGTGAWRAIMLELAR